MDPSTPVIQPPAAAETIIDDATAIVWSVSDPSAFDVIYRRHVRAIFVYVAARVGPQYAEDLVADVFVVAFANRARFRKHATSARPWLYGIAMNKLRQHRAAEIRWLHQPRFGERNPDDAGDRSNERLDAHAVVPELAAALAQLTPAERDVLVLYVFEGLTHREIAKALGIRHGTAKVRLHRGRERLRAAIEQGGSLG